MFPKSFNFFRYNPRTIVYDTISLFQSSNIFIGFVMQSLCTFTYIWFLNISDTVIHQLILIKMSIVLWLCWRKSAKTQKIKKKEMYFKKRKDLRSKVSVCYHKKCRLFNLSLQYPYSKSYNKILLTHEGRKRISFLVCPLLHCFSLFLQRKRRKDESGPRTWSQELHHPFGEPFGRVFNQQSQT